MSADNEFHTVIADPETDIGFAITSFGPEDRSVERNVVMMGYSFHGINMDITLSPAGAERLAARLLSIADQARRQDRLRANLKAAGVKL